MSSQGRLKEANRILKQMAHVNGRELPASDEQTLLQSSELQPEVGIDGLHCIQRPSKAFHSIPIAETIYNHTRIIGKGGVPRL